MNVAGIILLICAIAVLLALAGFVVSGYLSARLQRRFGPEYGRAVGEAGSTWRGEARLRRARKRVEDLRIRPLSRAESTRFADAWRGVQARFVDDPEIALAQADALIGEVLAARGYPVADFERSAENIAVDHPLVVEHYRTAHAVFLSEAGGRASTSTSTSTSTEDLRQAMIHYCALFDDLVREPGAVSLRRAG